MADTATASRAAGSAAEGQEADRPSPARRFRLGPVLITLITVLVAVPFAWAMWQAYMASPWTRDGRVRVYVVTLAPEVSGRVVELHVRDNQLVRRGDLVMRIDPRNYQVAVDLAQAALAEAEASLRNSQAEAQRRDRLSDLAISREERESFATGADTAVAVVQRARANLEQANINLERTAIRSPVNGWITNLLTQQGDYASAGQRSFSIVDSDSFWVDGYFQEDTIAGVREGDPASVKLMGVDAIIEGRVDSIARGIAVANAQPDGSGLASVNPIFTWVRLAQRVPVRVHLERVPPEVRLAAGMTATVQIDTRRD